MALDQSEGNCFDDDFEFDAPQWIDLESEKEQQLEDDSNSDKFDWWFQKVHPLHSPEITSPEPKPKRRPLRKSVLGFEGSELSTSKTSLPGKSSISGKSSLLQSKRDSESKRSKESHNPTTTGGNQGEDIKKPRRCWQLNEGNSSLSFSPQRLPTLPKHLQPKRCSSNTSLLPARSSSEPASSSSLASYTNQVKNKNLKTARRSCPQKLHTQKWNESSTKSNNFKYDDFVDEELQKMIDDHNKKILSQRSDYDLNGRKIKKTTSPVKTAEPKKENMKPGATKVNQFLKIEFDDDIQELIDKHNKRVWEAQNSEYDLNGRRVRQGNSTVVAAPIRIKSESQTTLPRSKSVRRSDTVENKQKRKNPSFSKTSEVGSKLNKTGSTSQNQTKTSTGTENEIQEIITRHNTRLAAKKAKK